MKQTSKGFRSSVPEKKTKAQYIFLNINHNITQPRDEVAALESPFLFFDTSCRINVNLIFLLIILLET